MRSDQIRRSKNQHQAKNRFSKKDDQNIQETLLQTIEYLNRRFGEYLKNHCLHYEKKISYKQMIDLISKKGVRKNFDLSFLERTIQPDGGLIFLRKKGNSNNQKVVLVSEMKRQGTNQLRLKEGLKKTSSRQCN